MNPLKEIRHFNNLSLKELSNEIDITTSALTSAEAGLYLKPPPRLIQALIDFPPPPDLLDQALNSPIDPPPFDAQRLTPASLTYLWHQWVHEQRQNNSPLLVSRIELSTARTFTQFLNEFDSLYALAKLLVFDIRTLQFYAATRAQGGKLFEALAEMLPADQVEWVRRLV
jgi:transcriptional regulator with XRE-family HTH domain